MSAPPLPVRGQTITLDMNDYGTGPGQWPYQWGTGDPVSTSVYEELLPFHINVSGGYLTVKDFATPPVDYTTDPPDDGDPIYLTGQLYTMDPVWQSYGLGDAQQYTGYIQLGFVYADYRPMKVSSVRLGLVAGQYWGASYWTTPPVTSNVMDVLWTPLGKDGNSSGATLSFYDDIGAVGGYGTRTEDCYGLIIDPRNPGYDNPAGYFIEYIEFTVGDNSGGKLRQRQSEVRAPSRVRGIDLRQRQTNRITG